MNGMRVDDLTHLVGPLTEDSIVRCLQARFYSQQYQTSVGPTLICLNPFHHVPSPVVLQDCHQAGHQLQGLVNTALSQHIDSGHSQLIVLSGEGGSGKTHCTMHILRLLYERSGGGTKTDMFRHLMAAMTVLRALASAETTCNTDSTRIGMYLENLTSDCMIYRTKIHGLFVDQGRVTYVPRREKNYHIFYQMLAGLSDEERVKLHLKGYSLHNLRYLSCGNLQQNVTDDMHRFDVWKSSLSVLGIPVMDILRVLAAILLLGNVEFVESPGMELEVVGNDEIKSVAALLGVSGVSLYRGFTTRTRHVHGHVSRSITDARSANSTRDALARALYYRTVSTVMKRVNSIRRQVSNLAQSMESLESKGSRNSAQYSHRPDILTTNPGDSSSTIQHGRKFSDGFVGIMDLFGFELAEVNQLEQLCVNLCAEAMQNFYNSHMFRSPLEALHEEGIQPEIDIVHFNNMPVIELLSSQTNGIVSILDTLTAQPKTTVETFVQEIKARHMINNYFFEPLPKVERLFGIRHFSGRVVYDASNFLSTNQDQVPDDIVSIFSKQNCNFGFASHLFAREVKTMSDNGQGPRGTRYRILPTNHHDTGKSDEDCRGSLCYDFQLRLDSLLKSVVNAKPHFIRCVRSNDHGEMDSFSPETVIQQIRSLQILETVRLMAGGMPHRMRYKVFNVRYCLFLPQAAQLPLQSPQEECRTILTSFLRAMDNSMLPYVSTQWTLGKKHLFYSEGTRQSLEGMRQERLHDAAAKIQACWRGSKVRRVWPEVRARLRTRKSSEKRLRHRSSYSSSSASSTQHLLEEEYRPYRGDRSQPHRGEYSQPHRGDHSQPHRADHSQPHRGDQSQPHRRDQSQPNRGDHSQPHRGDHSQSHSGPPQSNKIDHQRHNRDHYLHGMDHQGINHHLHNVDHPSRKMDHEKHKVDQQTSRLERRPVEKVDERVLQQICSMYSINQDSRPPVPSRRNYLVYGGMRLEFPHYRIMKHNFAADSQGLVLMKGQEVKVVGVSQQKGYVRINYCNTILHVPHDFLDFKSNVDVTCTDI
ncbi:unconventional myosin-IXb-like [Haliotis rufescens]|uniref:unconventional myosin-IXb-like n=1 Tax=Haliotis rufescens TaxID=6454 RepID=UPI00201E9707|nr:unconventional myosin-IXb-like [Haliotis rufescens]XP_046361538.2 unconventional myosin-IXb-like [Haliotis rufescens]